MGGSIVLAVLSSACLAIAQQPIQIHEFGTQGSDATVFETQGWTGLYQRPGTDSSDPLEGLSLIPHRDHYSFLLWPEDSATGALSPTDGKAQMQKRRLVGVEFKGDSATARLRASAARVTINMQRELIPFIFTNAYLIRYAALAVGASSQHASVRPATSAEVSTGTRLRKERPLDTTSPWFEVGFRSLFGVPESSVEAAIQTFRASTKPGDKSRMPVPLTFHHFDDANPPVVQIYRLDVKKNTRQWLLDAEGIPLRVVRYSPGPNGGQGSGGTGATGDLSSFVVEPATALAPGEYALVTIDVSWWFRQMFPYGNDQMMLLKGGNPPLEFYCFGVDPDAAPAATPPPAQPAPSAPAPKLYAYDNFLLLESKEPSGPAVRYTLVLRGALVKSVAEGTGHSLEETAAIVAGQLFALRGGEHMRKEDVLRSGDEVARKAMVSRFARMPNFSVKLPSGWGGPVYIVSWNTD